MALISFPKLNPLRRNKRITRAHQRYECCIVSEVIFLDRGFRLEGALREISIGGCLFRPSSVYLLDRRMERIVVTFERGERPGMIMNTRAEGYGVKFDEPLDPAQLDALGGEFGLQPVDALH